MGELAAGGQERGAMLRELLNIGEIMVSNGAEIKRVEDTLERLGRACGADRMNVFVITSSMVVTMSFADGFELTQTRRIRKPGGTDFGKLEDLNDLSRRFCAQPMSCGQLHDEVEKIKVKSGHTKLKFYLGSILAAAGFCVFFGGSLWDGLAAAFFAVIICLLQRYLDPFCTNRLVFNVICAFLTGLGISLAASRIPWLNVDKIMIGDIMLVIPGIALTNAVRDILVGDTISGAMRLIEALLWAAALSCGFMAAIWLVL